MLGILIGVCAIALGMKAFSVTGLPLTKTRRLTGTAGKVTGVICVLIGLVFVVDGVYAIVNIVRKI